SAVYNFATM
nr:Chain C, SYNTHETIC PEPTIDE WITH SEQUENCE SER-ALA-VAL-TYR-ASN-PHE-ALA-THR-MET1FFP_F Chain F, SYNTHETIC PEPTIDE WITH SEQUENCE SER-ALA-VAL-TYR-ASN-PHE-ALA-THR-MET